MNKPGEKRLFNNIKNGNNKKKGNNTGNNNFKNNNNNKNNIKKPDLNINLRQNDL